MKKAESFSGSLKSGIINQRFNNNQSKFLCLYGILRTLKKCSENEIVFKTENENTARLFSDFCDLVVGQAGSVISEVSPKSDGTKLFKMSVKEITNRKKLIAEFGIDLSGSISRELIDSFFTADFFAGVFLSVGNITDPEKGYHMEFSFPLSKTADDFSGFTDLLPENFSLKKMSRGSRTILYTKSADNISDFLTFIGASDAALKLINTEIFKNVRNKANRIANCDSANIERAVMTGARQAEEIEFIYKHFGRDSLSPALRYAADIRLENPELTLAELGELFEPPLSRSGVNRRLRKLSEISKKARG